MTKSKDGHTDVILNASKVPFIVVNLLLKNVVVVPSRIFTCITSSKKGELK